MSQEWILGILIFMVTVGCGGVVILNSRERQRLVSNRLNKDPIEGEGDLGKRTLFVRVAHWTSPIRPASKMAEYETLLLRTGRENQAPEELHARQIIYAVLSAATGFTICYNNLSVALFLVPAMFLLGYLWPVRYLRSVVAHRRKQAREELLDYSQLLEKGVAAGLSLQLATQRVSSYANGVLASEFKRTFEEISRNKPREQAFRDLAFRIDEKQVYLFIDAIIEAEKHGGTRITKVLKEQKERLRTEERNKSVENAQKATVKLLAPCIGLSLLPLIILILAPALIGFGKVFQF